MLQLRRPAGRSNNEPLLSLYARPTRGTENWRRSATPDARFEGIWGPNPIVCTELMAVKGRRVVLTKGKRVKLAV
jgi:hypothetical protein